MRDAVKFSVDVDKMAKVKLVYLLHLFERYGHSSSIPGGILVPHCFSEISRKRCVPLSTRL
ncbi:hypothetical protein PR003_g25100 [Phytophthora rubi]|uniref:Uncharacterized protein n=1 Tax=Phytophthora rubi TaxID=129364 RepID=A0A6A4CHD3_9STRA|nr:hypothetical protein PR003_g25100 [Phytophthora rubi]